MKQDVLQAVDLFCGAGGTSRGLAEACEQVGQKVNLLAINHWQMAVDTHKRNHPWARHLCQDLETVNPKEAVPSGRVNILLASPECTDHSTAKGGRPKNDQRRATAWCVLKWAQELYIDTILIENVPEFRKWGPIGADGHPLKSKRGETFLAYIGALKSLGYTVEHRLCNSADYEAPTTRTRLFILARRGRGRILWPVPSRSKNPGTDMFGSTLKPRRPARDIIDWTIPGKSIFDRKKPLAKTTIERIEAGILKFCGDLAEPFLVVLRGTLKRQVAASARSVDEPLPTVTSGGVHAGLAQPFLIPFYSEREGQTPRTHSVEDPVPTIPTDPKFALVQPFILPHRTFKNKSVDSVEKPLRTIVGKNGRNFWLVQPFILPPEGIHRGNKPRSVEEPMQTITASRGGGWLVQPFILPQNSSNKPRSVEQPVPTLTTTSRGVGLVQPFIAEVAHGGGKGRRTHSTKDPLGTVLTSNRFGLVEPFIAQVNHGGSKSGRLHSVDKPLMTVTIKNGFMLVEPFIVTPGGADLRGGRKASDPLPTVTASERFAVVEPFIVGTAQTGSNSKQVRSAKDPLQTIDGHPRIAVVQPWISKYNGTARKPKSVDAPLETVTSKQRFALVDPKAFMALGGYIIDIHFRMLRPHELAGAMGFPKDYVFGGTVADQVMQIGNAVQVDMARALILAILAA